MTTGPVRARAVIGVAAALSLALSSCGDDRTDDGSSRPAPQPPPGGTAEPVVDAPADLPPTDPLELAPRYGQAFADHGLELTARGGLVERDGYRASPTGTHLALYAAPLGPRSPEDYLLALVSLAAAVAPDLFERHPGLESFDICQEVERPVGGSDGHTPETVTQVDMTRAQVEALDWDRATLVDLLRVIRDLPGGSVSVRPSVADLDPWQEAVAELNGPSGG